MTATTEGLPLPPPAVNRRVEEIISNHGVARPYSPAICSASVYLNYREMDRLSSQLAAHVAAQGLKPGSIVPILSSKSALVIVAMLAVIKAGGAFTALDTSYPDERLSDIIKSTKTSILLSSPDQALRFSGIPGLSIVEFCNLTVPPLDQSPEPLTAQTHVSPGDIMYTIFTSGSTGKPKGVMIEHCAWLTSALAYGSDQGLGHSSRVLQFASYAFDMSLMEIFTTLIFGGCVCVPTEEDRFGAVEEFVNKTGVNTLMLTPSYAKLLDPTSMPSVKILIIGGEAVPSSLVETWNAHVEVYIAYGPTEASIQAAGAKIALGGLAPPSGLIGKPTGCNLWIVKEDNHNELVTMGDTGELLIEGHTLARGYLDDQSKTNTSFVDARISQGSIRRVFKTGDLVRQTTDGNIVFVGRKDTQVKVQGQRFEVTEIEATLSPLLGSGSKLCVDKVESLNSLVAFVSTSMRVSSKDNHADISWDQVKPTLEKIPKIRASLERILPMAMIPSLFIPVTFIPLTTSYKTDRKTLRGLVQDMGSSEVQKLQKLDTSVDKTEPISSSQLALRDLWALVLDRKSETIALDDNFIQLGGNSVTSIRLISAARSRGITLTSSMIFSNPALREQAQKASFSYAEGYQGSIPPFVLLEGRSTELCALAAAVCGLPIEEIDDILPMTISQMRWYGKTLAKPTAWLDQYHFRLPADVDLGRFAKALNSTIQASELLRARSLVTEDKKFFQIIVKFCQVNLVQVHEVLEVYLDRDLNIPMGVGAPLSRYAIVKNPNDDNVFVWTIHHAIYDGYSLSMLLQTIEDAYQGLHPAPFTPFNSYLKGPADRELLAGESFWEHYLEGSCWTRFPGQLSPAEKLVPSMSRLVRTLTATSEQGSSCIGKGAKFITTANMIRVAYGASLLLHSSERPSSVLFLESLGGRNSTLPGIDRVAGPTLLTIPTRLHLSRSKSCHEVLHEAQASMARRMEFENFPLPRLLPFAPPLELHNVLMIEDEAFLMNGAGRNLFSRGKEELKLDETEGLPMIFRCTISASAIHVDVRYDEHVVNHGEMATFLGTFEKVFREFWQGDGHRSFGDILEQ